MSRRSPLPPEFVIGTTGLLLLSAMFGFRAKMEADKPHEKCAAMEAVHKFDIGFPALEAAGCVTVAVMMIAGEVKKRQP